MLPEQTFPSGVLIVVLFPDGIALAHADYSPLAVAGNQVAITHGDSQGEMEIQTAN